METFERGDLLVAFRLFNDFDRCALHRLLLFSSSPSLVRKEVNFDVYDYWIIRRCSNAYSHDIRSYSFILRAFFIKSLLTSDKDGSILRGLVQILLMS